MHPNSVRYAAILLAGLPATKPTPTVPPAVRPKLTPRELTRAVALLGKGWPLERVIDQIQQERPTLPFDPREDVDPPEAA